MEKRMRVVKITELPFGFDNLIEESKGEGFNFLDKMSSEWKNGRNRFSLHNECLFAAISDHEKLLGIGGLNLDPYLNDLTIGRVRHLFITSEMRNQGIGKTIIEKIVEAACPHFRLLRLRTNNPEAVNLYRSLGFSLIDHEDRSHFYMEKNLK
jgi:GNAT superfamily N-acetyltransferase